MDLEKKEDKAEALEKSRLIRSIRRAVFMERAEEFLAAPTHELHLLLSEGIAEIIRLDNFISMMVEVEEIAKETIETETYLRKWAEVRAKCQPPTQTVATPEKIRVRPKLELRKFDGDPRKYLPFWGQFSTFHDDNSLTNEVKFEYLLASMAEESKAKTFIEKFSPNDYVTAIKEFKDRFGDEKKLKQLYVRDLVGLVIKRKDNTSLPDLFDQLQGLLCALRSLGVTGDQLNTLLLPLVELSLPDEELKAWERSGKTDDMDELLKFMKGEADRISNNEERQKLVDGLRRDQVPTTAALLAPTFQKVCIFCGKTNHSYERCFKAKRMKVEEVRQVLESKNRCLKCTRPNHSQAECRSQVVCLSCKGDHHVLLCNSTNLTVTNHVSVANNVSLQTLIVNVFKEGTWVKKRAIFDSGSQLSYVSKALTTELNSVCTGKQQLRQGVFGGEERPPSEVEIHTIKLSSVTPRGAWECKVIKTGIICKNIPKVRDDARLELRKQNHLLYDSDAEVDILIGADYLGKLLTGNCLQLECGATAIETLLGWTVIGRSTPLVETSLCMTTLSLNITALWDLDVLGILERTETKNRHATALEAMEHFRQTTEVVDGRYQVRLPFLDGHPPLLTNRHSAEKRNLSVTEKLKKDGLFTAYDNVFRDWLEAGIIEVAPPSSDNNFYYLPHRPVLKLGSTTKIRPVFDASARDPKGTTLNACLNKGPNMIETIPSILTRFRVGPFAAISDIHRAFLQIQIHPDDRDHLRFLWWKDGKLIELRHTRVVFGLTSSPFHLAATIEHHLAADVPPELEKTAEKLRKSFYVDDSCSSFDSLEELEKFKLESVQLMKAGKFDLVGWHRTGENSDAPVSVLGIQWNLADDTLQCIIPNFQVSVGEITKRVLLSQAQSVFDPVGFLVPNLLTIKCLLQKAWKLKIPWDNPLPEALQGEIREWINGLPLLSLCRVPRSLGVGFSNDTQRQIHVFTDASKSAYATCVFVRSEHDGNVDVQLVQAKARVAPMSDISIPRLELLAALIGARLYDTIVKELGWEHLPVYFWSDSSVVLSWLKQPTEWTNFVQNRVREILNLTNINDWHHVPGGVNPADLPSRGCTARQLLETSWWQGPVWLKDTPTEWPSEPPGEAAEANEERRKVVNTFLTVNRSSEPDPLGLFQYYSSYRKTVRLVASLFRYYDRLRKRPTGTGAYTSAEMERAEKRLIYYVQQTGLEEKHLIGLRVVKDENELLCVQTRLVNSENPSTVIILPGNHVLVHRLIREWHLENSHAGVLTLLVLLRSKFWVTQARCNTKKILNRCLRCQRYKVRAACAPQGPLPIERTDATSKAFAASGVDCFGPMFTKDGGKVWGLIFTCCTYRAIHLEIVQAMTTDSFLLALRRFIARRGRVMTIYSDNGLNFVGMANEIEEHCTGQRIRWIRNPPTASWYGGFFERMIQCVKRVLRRNLGQARLSLEELNTVLCDTEALINSRPLTYLSEDPDELQAISPANFLLDNVNTTVDDLDQIDRETLCKRAIHVHNVRNDLRIRLKEEYLALLVHRSDGQTKELKVGDLVLVGSDDKKRTDWPLGRVLELHQGRDGVSRVCRVKVKDNQLLRPLQRIYPLEWVNCVEGNVSNSGFTSNDAEANAGEGDETTEVATVEADESEQVSAVSPPQPQPQTAILKTRSGRIVKQKDILNL